MSLLTTKVAPVPNGEYEITIKSYKEISNDKGGYVETVLQLPNREYGYNIFPSQVEYVTSAIRNQFNMKDQEVTLAEMLEKASKESIKVWFSYNEDIGRMNVAFHAPRVAETAISDEDLDLA